MPGPGGLPPGTRVRGRKQESPHRPRWRLPPGTRLSGAGSRKALPRYQVR